MGRGRLPRARTGKRLVNQPTGFPAFFGSRRKPRVITSDVWAFLRNHSQKVLKGEAETKALAYIDQAFEFYEAGANPRISSRPVLYYYSFLNLVKLLLIHRNIALPPAVRHGISDPKANIRRRLRFESQAVRVEVGASDHSNLFPELIGALSGKSLRRPAVFLVKDLMAQIPGIHRTYCQVVDWEPIFCPLYATEILSGGSSVWVRIRLKRHGTDVNKTLPKLRNLSEFERVLTQVEPHDADNEVWFETKTPVPGSRKGIDAAIRVLWKQIQSCGVWALLTGDGYRYYLGDVPAARRFPQLCSAYAIMFYLGSLTRYKPYDFDKIIKRDYAWLVSEFLETQPLQFVYVLASTISGVDVVRPFALP